MDHQSSQPCDAGSVAQEARRSPRRRANAVLCNLGEVFDLSNFGVRVRGGYLEPSTLQVIILVCAQQRIGPLKARVVWSNKITFVKHESGMEFLDVDVVTEGEIARFVVHSRHTNDPAS